MSNNYNLLLKIRDNLENNPSFIKELPVKDIIDCVIYELHEIRQFYESEHYDAITKEMLEYASEMMEMQDAGDSVGALKLFDSILRQHRMIPDVEVALPFIERANYDKALNRHILEGTVIAMGDSHSCFFSGNQDLSLKPILNDISTCDQLDGHPFTVLHLGPCLAYSCDKYGSTNRVREKVEWLEGNFFLEGDTIIFSLGEIDVRTQVYKQVQAGRDYKEVVDEILEHYMKLLLWLKERGYRVICYGPIGSLKDSAPLDDYRPRVGSEQQRNQAGRYYNERLEEICREQGLEFFTLFYDMVNDDNETDERFLSGDQFHLGQYGYQLAIDKLRCLGLAL